MENQNDSIHVINSTISYRLDNDMIRCRCLKIDGKKYAIQIFEIFGCKVSWTLNPFKITDVYEYFEKQIFEDIESNLFNKHIEDCYTKHTNLSVWITDNLHDEMRLELMDFCLTLGINWDMMFRQIIDKLGEAGYMGRGFYHYLILGYLESVAKEFFTIDIKKIKYVAPQLNISFNNDIKLSVKSVFFTGHNFYNELTRLTTTENLLTDIRADVKELLICNQKII